LLRASASCSRARNLSLTSSARAIALLPAVQPEAFSLGHCEPTEAIQMTQDRAKY
jgi:hypothetical protein